MLEFREITENNYIECLSLAVSDTMENIILLNISLYQI